MVNSYDPSRLSFQLDTLPREELAVIRPSCPGPIFLPNREENRWLAEKLGVPDGVALVRPDAMLAYRGPAEAQALELYLQEVSGPGPG